MALSEDFMLLAKEFLQMVSKELDPHTSTKGEIKVEGLFKVSLFTPSHIQFAKYGRGPGKKPPLDPILEWVKGKGIIFDNTDAKGTAFAIQASIGKNGTLGWVPNAPNVMEEAIDKHFDEYFTKLGVATGLTISQQVEETWKDIFPEKIEFKI